jgi:TonB-linked SusC/RagA family outer membrane protein
MMKAIPILLFAACLQVSAKAYSQEITLSLSNAKLETVFTEIQKQTDYRFIYTREELEDSKKVNIEVKKVDVETVLRLCMRDQPLTYVLEDRFIIIRLKEKEDAGKNSLPEPQDIRGRITNEQGEPLAGVTITVKGTTNGTASNENGEFILKDAAPNAILIFSSIGYYTQEINLQGRTNITVQLKIEVSNLDETVVIAYGTTTKRLNTGSVGKVTASEIGKQPVSNPLAALQARVPGLLITQSSGIPGSAFKVQIRGQNSLIQGSEPLFIVDGVPFIFGNTNINQLTTAASLSPFNLINPNDIESIEVLKDADATAIYGSRGANGVILITTKKGIAGKTKVNINVYTGISRVTRTMNMLNLQQYIDMRKEAFKNDGVSMTTFSAPDLLLWDSTRYTDLKKLLIGGTAHTTDAQLSFSGGNENTKFLMGGGYHKETTVFPTDLADTRSSFHFNLNHISSSKKFVLTLIANYSLAKNQLPTADLTNGIKYSPNIKLYDSSGKLNWEEGGVPFWNIGVNHPLGDLYTKYTGAFQNLISNLQISYRILPGLNLKTSLGYNLAFTDENKIYPSTSISPYDGTKPYSFFSTGNNKSWIAEPQVEYTKQISQNKFSILLGSTWQKNTSTALNTDASEYSSDLLLNSISGAGKIITRNLYSEYRYAALFGRLGYQLKDRYILNLTGRKDGSSRFGPDDRFSYFGSMGFAWIFSSEKIISKSLPFLSYGKIRGSLGTTGNDQIGNYKFLDTWTSSSGTYQNIPGLSPTALFNPNLAWESVKKIETAIELGFLKDRILMTVAYFRNRSGNQLASYALPIQTGFSSVSKNFDALIQNKGVEVSFTSKNITSKNLKWTSSFNLTVLRNKLLAFENLSTSSYFNTYVVGQALSTRKLYEYTGVDPNSGIYQFTDVDRNGVFNTSDQIIFKNIDPKFYGGFINSISYKNFELDITLEYKKQEGLNYLNTLSLFPPGYGPNKNQPIVVLNRWQKPGDITDIGKFTGTFGSPAYTATINNLTQSNAIYGDASYIRLKNVSLSYRIPGKWTTKIKLDESRIYFQAQNLFTITNYVGSDPENQNLYVLPPLRTITAGMILNF